jgi:hypothetical protein
MVKNILQNSSDLQNTSPTFQTAAVANPFGMVLVEEQIASGVLSLQFLNLAQYPFTIYKLFVWNGYFSSGSPLLYLQGSTTNGSPFSATGYYSQNGSITYGSSSWSQNTINVGFLIMNAWTGTLTRNCEHTLWNVNNSGQYFSHHGQGVSRSGTATPNFDEFSGTYTGSTSAINAFQLISSNGILFYGTFSLYGIS